MIIRPSEYLCDVRPFDGDDYYENARKAGKYEPCAVCGKPVKNVTRVAVVIDGGASWGDENSDESDPGYMGGWPVGSDCFRKHFRKIERTA